MSFPEAPWSLVVKFDALDLLEQDLHGGISPFLMKKKGGKTHHHDVRHSHR